MTWAAVMLQLTDSVSLMLVITMVQPVVLASIGHGVQHGVVLALFGAVCVLFNRGLGSMAELSVTQVVLALAVLFVVPGAALLARPMSLIRSRMALVDELENQIDPRRGLEPICAALVERLRNGTDAELVALVLPSSLGAPAMIASRDEGSFRAAAAVHERIEGLLRELPSCAATYASRSWWDPRAPARLAGEHAVAARQQAQQQLAVLAALLDVRCLHVVPLVRYARRHGHLVVGCRSGRGAAARVAALSQTAAELLRIVEQAALVDQLQEESAGHERARIGRDLHDSAIQPYLGLKYAVECVALRIPHDNPARAEVDALAELVNGEVAALRELISGLRTGNTRGDNALVPAVRRQVRRFALLFGIEIELDCPDSLPTTRALASALFHMVNETLNNVRKHTEARHVRIVLASDGTSIRLCVRDDGAAISGRPAGDFVPGSLSERVRELGGSLQLTRPDGLNTELVIQVPIEARAAEAAAQPC
jgi:signal transduction histidine kinase